MPKRQTNGRTSEKGGCSMVKKLIRAMVLAAVVVGLVMGPGAARRASGPAQLAGRMAPCALDGGGSTA